ncbi:hypothetical protein EOD39_12992 [Acipenser ruthenus]|uniref:Uncharacterized protein n=1 Tax=Acipenser ruthenus TaxID=7906 RepID=A0A444UJN9_ACIRT|nr:hypothetical protein EOD39_12992 [Acipenser ruthenus]
MEGDSPESRSPHPSAYGRVYSTAGRATSMTQLHAVSSEIRPGTLCGFTVTILEYYIAAPRPRRPPLQHRHHPRILHRRAATTLPTATAPPPSSNTTSPRRDHAAHRYSTATILEYYIATPRPRCPPLQHRHHPRILHRHAATTLPTATAPPPSSNTTSPRRDHAAHRYSTATILEYYIATPRPRCPPLQHRHHPRILHRHAATTLPTATAPPPSSNTTSPRRDHAAHRYSTATILEYYIATPRPRCPPLQHRHHPRILHRHAATTLPTATAPPPSSNTTSPRRDHAAHRYSTATILEYYIATPRPRCPPLQHRHHPRILHRHAATTLPTATAPPPSSNTTSPRRDHAAHRYSTAAILEYYIAAPRPRRPPLQHRRHPRILHRRAATTPPTATAPPPSSNTTSPRRDHAAHRYSTAAILEYYIAAPRPRRPPLQHRHHPRILHRRATTTLPNATAPPPSSNTTSPHRDHAAHRYSTATILEYYIAAPRPRCPTLQHRRHPRILHRRTATTLPLVPSQNVLASPARHHWKLAQFELAAIEHIWSSAIKASYLTQSLEGSALESLLDLEPEERADYRVLLRALKRRFGESESYLLLQNQLQNRRQIHGERLGALAADINRLARRTYCSKGNSFIRRIALDAFLRSIEPPELRYQVHLAALPALDEAIDCAITIEAVFLDQPAAHCPTSHPISWTQPDMDREREPYPAKVRSASHG